MVSYVISLARRRLVVAMRFVVALPFAACSSHPYRLPGSFVQVYSGASGELSRDRSTDVVYCLNSVVLPNPGSPKYGQLIKEKGSKVFSRAITVIAAGADCSISVDGDNSTLRLAGMSHASQLTLSSICGFRAARQAVSFVSGSSSWYVISTHCGFPTPTPIPTPAPSSSPTLVPPTATPTVAPPTPTPPTPAPTIPYYQMEAGDNGCPSGEDVATLIECEQAFDELGIDRSDPWVGEYSGVLIACSINVENPGGFHWNTASSGSPRFDLAPICKRAT